MIAAAAGLFYLLGLMALFGVSLLGVLYVLIVGALPPPYENNLLRALQLAGLAYALLWIAVNQRRGK